MYFVLRESGFQKEPPPTKNLPKSSTYCKRLVWTKADKAESARFNVCPNAPIRAKTIYPIKEGPTSIPSMFTTVAMTEVANTSAKMRA